jgi:hypothetical protein
VAEATRAARTAVVSPKATSPSLQGHRAAGKCRSRGVGRCRGRGLRRCRECDLRRCWGRGVGIGSVPVRLPSRPTRHGPLV